MTRTIATAAEHDALPVGSVVRNASRGITAERLDDGTGAVIGNAARFPWRDLWSPGSVLVLLHDPSTPAAQPVVSDTAVEAALDAMRAHSKTLPPPHEYQEVCCAECGYAASYPGCTAEQTERRAREHVTRATLTAAAPLLTAQPAPEASREDVERLVGQTLGLLADDDGNLGHDTEGRLTDALRARFVITERTEQVHASLETMRVTLNQRDRARIVQHGSRAEDGRQ